jgi:type 1 fimbriae regulatory protein FimB
MEGAKGLRRGLNSLYRSREYLTPDEMEMLLIAANCRGRHQTRDRALLLLMFRHGLRVSEALALRWDALMLEGKTPSIMIARLKGSESGSHPLQWDEVEALRMLRVEYPGSGLVFVSERGGGLSVAAVQKLVSRCGVLAKLDLPVHPHMLRHSCGYYLANKGFDTRLIQDWLGHKSIQHTVRYTKLNPARFNEISWD